MKNIVYFLFTALLLSSCLGDDCESTRTFTQYEAIFITSTDLRKEIELGEPKDLVNPGKIYFYQNYIFINEIREGIHIIDNSDPSNPTSVAFYHIPGNVDIAIRGNYLYADSYTDLVTIDIENILEPKELCRNEDMFINEHYFQEGFGYFAYFEETENTIEIGCDDPNFNRNQISVDRDVFSSNGFPETAGGFKSGDSGQGGSFARFTLINDFLYVIDQQTLYAFGLEDGKPHFATETYVDWSIETIFPYQNYLFIGATSGMFIFDNTNPGSPQYVSEFRHANACDPVVVKDEIAYVTLRSGNECESFTNQLDVIDVSNIENPTLLHTYEMDNPHGLSAFGDHLYICEGESGLKVFEISDLSEINKNRTDYIDDHFAYDVISLSDDHILVIGEDGFYQYDTSDKEDLVLISSIKPVEL